MADDNSNEQDSRINDFIAQQRELNEMQKAFMQQQRDMITTQCDSLTSIIRKNAEVNEIRLKNVNLILTVIFTVLTSLSGVGIWQTQLNSTESRQNAEATKTNKEKIEADVIESKRIDDAVSRKLDVVTKTSDNLENKYEDVSHIVNDFPEAVNKAVADEKFTSGAVSEYSGTDKDTTSKVTERMISLEQKACNLSTGCKEYIRDIKAVPGDQIVYWVNIVNKSDGRIADGDMRFKTDLPQGFVFKDNSERLWYRDDNRVDKLMKPSEGDPFALRHLLARDDFTLTFVATIDDNVAPEKYTATHTLLNKNNKKIDSKSATVTVVDSRALSR